jgi:methylthioribose-1-phosphate isomerase
MTIHYIFVMLTINYYNFVKLIHLLLYGTANTIFQGVSRFTIFWERSMLRHLATFPTFTDYHYQLHITTNMNYNGTHYRTIWPDPQDPQKICIIDQRKLPHNFIVEKIGTAEEMISAIRDMHVRGAGLIGAAAGFGMYLAALQAPDRSFDTYMADAARRFDASRPTARNLMWAVERILQMIGKSPDPDEKRAIAFAVACTIADEDAHFCRRIGEHGLKIIEEISRKKNSAPVNILTHCNAGWLAFVDYGSATAPIYAARDAGLPVHVWVDETRPWNQGSRLTAWELQQEGIPHTLICDNTGGYLMQLGQVDMVIVGADRVTHTGDVVNKIGTYLKALAAKDNGVPFFVALPSSTFDWKLDNGMEIPIEQRAGEEITTLTGKDSHGAMRTVLLAGEETRAANYSFDVTPARLVTSLITERGIIKSEKIAIHQLFPEKGCLG